MHSNSQLRFYDTGTHTFFTYATDNPENLNRQRVSGVPKLLWSARPTSRTHATPYSGVPPPTRLARALASPSVGDTPPPTLAHARTYGYPFPAARGRHALACVTIPPCVVWGGLYVSIIASRFPPMPSARGGIRAVVPLGVRPACLHPVCRAVRPCRFCAFCGVLHRGVFGRKPRRAKCFHMWARVGDMVTIAPLRDYNLRG